MTMLEWLIGHSRVYELWQAPFAERKLGPMLAHNDLSMVRRVLDVACGPGTNAKHFADAEYTGVDLNEGYVQYAARRYRRTFVRADMTTFRPPGGQFDFVLVNSFLHHLGDAEVEGVLRRLRDALTPDGAIHVLELVLPRDVGLARMLARWDRGRFARPLPAWERLLTRTFAPEVFEPYTLAEMGVPLWYMVYFKGRLAR